MTRRLKGLAILIALVIAAMFANRAFGDEFFIRLIAALEALGTHALRRADAGRGLVGIGNQKRPELAAQLLKQWVFFSYALVRVELRLVLHTFGLATVDVRDLIGSVDSLRMQVGSLSAHHSAA